MRLSRVGMAALRELARRRPVAIEQDGPDAQEAAAALRRLFYPKQAAFFSSPARWKATRKTRRMGATTGGVREMLARALEQPGFRATYATSTRAEAISRAWRNDNKTGFVDVLAEQAESVKHPSLTAYKLGGVTIEVRETDLKLELSNGSQIELFGAENFRSQKRKRGNSKHVFWIDEAQDFVDLESFFDAVVIGVINDFEGEVWLTGTPGKDCAGMFYDVTKEPEEGEEPIVGWEVHQISVTDNPYFGHVIQTDTEYFVEDNARPPNRHGPYETRGEADRAAEQIRWDRTAGEAKRLKGWKGDEPDFVREWLGRWVKTDARYVYPVHAVPKHVLIFAPQRLADNPFVGTHPRFDGHPRWYDHHAAVADLPRPRRGQHQWLYGLWVDFGYSPDPFALVFGAFTPDLPDVYEMFSWKCTRVHTDDQAGYMQLLWGVSNAIVSFVGDPAGKQDDFDVWRSRMNLPIEEANKKGKNTLEEFLADDIRRGRVHFREGSPLVTEMRHLVYLPSKPGKTREVHKHRKVNGIVHGDHCCDAARYGYADLTHYLAKLPKDKPQPGSREAFALEAEEMERGVETAEQKRAAELMERDEQMREYGDGNGEYGWQ
jgi:hypothetical protein